MRCVLTAEHAGMSTSSPDTEMSLWLKHIQLQLDHFSIQTLTEPTSHKLTQCTYECAVAVKQLDYA